MNRNVRVDAGGKSFELATGQSRVIKELLTLDRFIDWLRTKPADERYEYRASRARYNSKGCAVVQFVAEHGFKEVSVDPFTVYWKADADAPVRSSVNLPRELDRISYSAVTFGGALRVAEALKGGALT